MVFEREFAVNNERVYFCYSGTEKTKDINTSKLEEVINNIFNNTYFNWDLIRVISYLRTILKEFDEDKLIVKVKNSQIHKFVEFQNGELIQYSKKEFLSEDGTDNQKITFNYQHPGKVNYSFSDTTISNNVSEYFMKERIKSSISNSMDECWQLKNNIKPVTLNNDDRTILTVYNLFYNEIPDLSDLIMDSKFQNMLFILSEAKRIVLKLGDEDVAFYNYGKYPQSILLSEWIKRLRPLSTNVEFIHSDYLNKESVEAIKGIGEYIKKNFENPKYPKISLERFCYAIYYKKYMCRSNISLKEIAEKMKNKYFGEFSEEELEYYFELKDKMDKK